MNARIDSLKMPMPGKVYRVVQWATGRIGQISLRELITCPQCELVGVYVHSESKEGIDAGELCGLPATGVKATRHIDKLIALQPDCVVSNMEGGNVDDVCRFLAAGINIATSRVDFLEPERMDPQVRERVQAACLKGGSSIHSTGSSPGFSSEALPLVAMTMSRRMDCMTIDEYADIPASCPDFQCKAMGFGREAGGSFDPHLLAHIAYGFEQSITLVAKALGVSFERIDVFGESAGATQRFVLPGGTPIEQGQVAAQRITIAGIRNGKPLINFRINWYCSKQIDQDWDLRQSGWRLHIEGDTPVDIHVTFPVAGDKLSPAMAGITGYRVINAVPYVCAAAPGIRTTAELPMVVPRLW